MRFEERVHRTVLALFLDHFAQWLTVGRLACRADIVDRGFAVQKQIIRQTQGAGRDMHIPRSLLDFNWSGLNPDEDANVEVDGKGQQRLNETTITSGGDGY